MKRNVKVLSLVMLFVLVFTSSATASVSGIGLSIDGIVKSDSLEVVEGRTLIGGNDLENMDFDVSSSKGIATVKNEDVTFKFTLDTNKVQVNDIELSLDTKSFEKEGEVYIPLRFVLETLGYEIKWDGENKRVVGEKLDEITYPVALGTDESKYIVTKEPKTIISLAPNVTEIVFALDAGNKVMGRTQYCNYPQEVELIPNVGNMTDPSLEMIVDIDPDMVIAATHYKEEVLNKLNEAGIEIIALPSPNSIDEMYDFTLKLGAILNKNYEARALVSDMKAKVQMTKMKLSNVEERPVAYYVVGTGQWGEYTAGSDTFISEIISICGGKNAADDVTGWKYSIEKLIDKDPDIIFGGNYNIDIMTSGENYQILSAIKNKSYYTVNEDIFSRPSPRLIDQGLKVLLDILHKDIAKELNF